MPHVGNDIVDLTSSTSKKKSRNIRFLDRVFTPDEQNVILSSPFPDLKLWSFWAAKESAYKAISKVYPHVPSIPRLFSVYMNDDASADNHSRETGKSPFPLLNKGFVLTPEGKCWIQVDYRHTYIHCIAFTDVPENLIFSWRAHYLFSCRQKAFSQESEAVRLALRLHLARFLAEKFEDLEISRQKNGTSLAPPRVFSLGRPLDVDISLSHDGIFVAYACMEQQNA